MTEKLGRYELQEQLGEGGFAIVYRARDTELDRLVALKELRSLLLTDTTWVKRFRREAKAIARLDHPGIVPIYDIGAVNGREFIVMRLVDGPSLERLIEQGPVSWPKTAAIVSAIAEGLDYAHNQGVLHRDLKPGNVLLDAERGPMLSDFGFAKLVGESSRSVTVSGDVVGTPNYIAPEAWEGQEATPQTDIYALGCILYEMVTGEKLFQAETPPAVMMAHFKPLDLPSIWPEGVPPGIGDVLAKALARDPAYRYASVAEMRQALDALQKPNSQPVELERPLPEIASSVVEKPTSVRDQPDQIVPETQISISEVVRHRVNLKIAEALDKSTASQQSVSRSSSKLRTQMTNPDAKNLSPKWRGFLAHLGPYIIVITMLAIINWLTTSDYYPWFLWPALGWGAGLAFHFMGIVLSEMKNVSGKWRGFAAHFGSFAIIITMLGLMNMLTGGGIWFHWPALGWGAAVAIHFWSISMFGGGEEQRQTRDVSIREDMTQVDQKEQFDEIQEVTNPTILAHLQKAQLYQEQIETLINSSNDQRAKSRLQSLARQVGEWMEAIEALAKRIDRFERNAVIHHDLETVPRSIEKLEAQLAQETNQATRADLERTLANRRNQLAVLENLRNTMRRAEIQIENTLSSLGTIYSQILASQSTDHVADYGRLSSEVDEEVRVLEDHLEALEEVKLGGL